MIDTRHLKKGEILLEDFFCNVNSYFMVKFGYFCKANNKNFKFLSGNQTYYIQVMLHKHLLRMLMKEQHFDSAK